MPSKLYVCCNSLLLAVRSQKTNCKRYRIVLPRYFSRFRNEPVFFISRKYSTGYLFSPERNLKLLILCHSFFSISPPAYISDVLTILDGFDAPLTRENTRYSTLNIVFRSKALLFFYVCVCVHVCVYVRACVCVCECVCV